MENRNRTENPRRLALDVLGRVERGQYANLALDAALERAALSAEDRALATTLVYGVLEKQGRLDFALAGLSSRPVEELSPDVRALLRLGLYQLCFLDRVPDHAAVNETVALASRKTAGYVNAVLREEIRRGKALPLPGEDGMAGGAVFGLAGACGAPACRSRKRKSNGVPERIGDPAASDPAGQYLAYRKGKTA